MLAKMPVGGEKSSLNSDHEILDICQDRTGREGTAVGKLAYSEFGHVDGVEIDRSHLIFPCHYV
jgi:hypothetical protein